MQKIVIQMDEEKIIREDKYSLEKIYKYFDKVFGEFECIKEQGENVGEVIYAGNPKRDNYLNDLGIPCLTLQRSEWFRQNCIKYLWLENDDDESLSFDETDMLQWIREDYGSR